MKIRLDQERCTGHGRCYTLAPEVFDEDERGHCVVTLADVPDTLREKARRGVEGCPEYALEAIENAESEA